MRLKILAMGAGAGLFAIAAQAQPVAPQPPAPVPPANVPPPVEQVPSAAAQPGAVPGPDGVIHQWGPAQPVVQTAPAPATSYPPCTRGRTDSCYNPDPRKEADTKAPSHAEG
ncbi:MAG: hypothetical protein J7494_05595 [Sphingobium sp.]|nr:hypothetical protein [Sphingobium sp.]